jgi:hypothetical protein
MPGMPGAGGAAGAAILPPSPPPTAAGLAYKSMLLRVLSEVGQPDCYALFWACAAILDYHPLHQQC